MKIPVLSGAPCFEREKRRWAVVGVRPTGGHRVRERTVDGHRACGRRARIERDGRVSAGLEIAQAPAPAIGQAARTQSPARAAERATQASVIGVSIRTVPLDDVAKWYVPTSAAWQPASPLSIWSAITSEPVGVIRDRNSVGFPAPVRKNMSSLLSICMPIRYGGSGACGTSARRADPAAPERERETHGCGGNRDRRFDWASTAGPTLGRWDRANAPTPSTATTIAAAAARRRLAFMVANLVRGARRRCGHARSDRGRRATARSGISDGPSA